MGARNGKERYKQLVNAKWLPFDAKNDSANHLHDDQEYGGSLLQLEATPWGNEMIEDFAERDFEGEKLGMAAHILAVAFHRTITWVTRWDPTIGGTGHVDSHGAPAAREIVRLCGRLVGAGDPLVVLTADHGVAPVPEVNRAPQDAGRAVKGTSVDREDFGGADEPVRGGEVDRQRIDDAVSEFGTGGEVEARSGGGESMGAELAGRWSIFFASIRVTIFSPARATGFDQPGMGRARPFADHSRPVLYV